MIDFQDRYLKIVKKYLKDKFVDNNIAEVMEIIKKSIIQIDNNKYKNCAIWGAGQHTDNFMKYFSTNLKKVSFIIENNLQLAKEKFKALKVIAPEEINSNNIDCILISSYASRKEITKSIEKFDKNIKIIDIYENLQEKGINLNLPFYILSDGYIKINEYLQKLKECKENVENGFILENLLLEYIKLRDFKNIFKTINYYQKLEITENDKFNDLFNDLEEMLMDLKNILKTKKNNTSLLFIDALRYKDVNDNMKYIKKISENNVKFTNVFSTSITTYESMISCLSGKMPYYNQNYKRQSIEEYESIFIKKALSKNYNINFYVLGSDKFINSDNINYKDGGIYCSKTLWNYVCDMAVSDNKNISLLYFLQESHAPHMGGNYIENFEIHNTPFTSGDCNFKQTRDQYVNQYKKSLQYLDEQLEFYLNFLSDDNDFIIFSDHGQIIEDATTNLNYLDTILGWHDDRFKVNLIIKSNKFKRQKIKKIFSLIDLNDLLCGIIDGKLNVKYRDYIKMQFSSTNNKIIREKFSSQGKDDYINGFEIYRDKNYKLVVTGLKKVRAFKLVKNKEIEIFDSISIKKLKRRFLINDRL